MRDEQDGVLYRLPFAIYTYAVDTFRVYAMPRLRAPTATLRFASAKRVVL